ncbi:MAG: prolipoprotein diacylglyceryl transferase [Clostridia bacterium]|nr:prolipoprotein diacylglyceryl transferase [Clostridia bacterium]
MLPNPIFLNVHMYGVMIAVGLLACFLCLWYMCKKFDIEESFSDFMTFNGFASIIFGFFSAALFQAFYNYLENPARGFKFGGITFIGGLIGGIVCFVSIYLIFRKKFNSKLIDAISFVPLCIVIAHAFGRVGCFFAGCCYGIETDSWLGVKFPELSHKVLPTNLMEAIFLFILFGVMAYLVLKKNFKYNLSLYLIAYGIWRFIIEFFRGDDRGSFLLNLSPSQFWSIIMVIAGVCMIFILKIFFEKRQNEKL